MKAEAKAHTGCRASERKNTLWGRGRKRSCVQLTWVRWGWPDRESDKSLSHKIQYRSILFPMFPCKGLILVISLRVCCAMHSRYSATQSRLVWALPRYGAPLSARKKNLSIKMWRSLFTGLPQSDSRPFIYFHCGKKILINIILVPIRITDRDVLPRTRE
jgi:hypothetical protein